MGSMLSLREATCHILLGSSSTQQAVIRWTHSWHPAHGSQYTAATSQEARMKGGRGRTFMPGGSGLKV